MLLSWRVWAAFGTLPPAQPRLSLAGDWELGWPSLRRAFEGIPLRYPLDVYRWEIPLDTKRSKTGHILSGKVCRVCSADWPVLPSRGLTRTKIPLPRCAKRRVRRREPGSKMTD
jgi:hypothetical protein